MQAIRLLRSMLAPVPIPMVVLVLVVVVVVVVLVVVLVVVMVVRSPLFPHLRLRFVGPEGIVCDVELWCNFFKLLRAAVAFLY